jgi:NADH:ubiquinone oxidoreductase subunit H
MKYSTDKRIVMTLDAGGTNFVFSAIQSGNEILQPLQMPSNASNLDLCLKTIVDGQMAAGSYWNIVYQPLGFIIFFVCALAECNRTPFDLPEAENELNFGYHQEYSSMKLGFYLFSEYINMIMSSAVMASLYFGGFDVPFFSKKIPLLSSK